MQPPQPDAQLFPAEVVRRSLALNTQPSEGGLPRELRATVGTSANDQAKVANDLQVQYPSAGRAESAAVRHLSHWSNCHRKASTSILLPNTSIRRRPRRCFATYMPRPKLFVYILRSEREPPRYYTGLTSDPAARLEDHNAGRCTHTATGRPWQLDALVQFADDRRALAFERYLKSGSGSAFARRHFR